jgi:stalled ribosome alternative rescue factor ArfA
MLRACYPCSLFYTRVVKAQAGKGAFRRAGALIGFARYAKGKEFDSLTGICHTMRPDPSPPTAASFYEMSFVPECFYLESTSGNNR